MTSREIRERFLKFFERRGHQIVPSSSLIPDDPSVLLTTAGMQQFIPYLSGQAKPPFQRACSCQKCFRTVDIEKVGNETHHTFFEMLGNWSFGDYFKEGAIKYALEFLVDELGMAKDKLWVTVFQGEKGIPRDEEAVKIWQEQGIAKERIFEFGLNDNFWGPTGQIGPCGPCSEIHYDLTGQPCQQGENCGPNCQCGRFVEIWNLVFMEYNKDDQGNYQPLPQKNIDTGIGFERLVAVLQDKNSSYETDLFSLVMQELPGDNLRSRRIIADHIRGACFLITDGVLPSNIEQGYILRRILRRAIRYGQVLNLPENFLIPLAQKVIETYQDVYSELQSRQNEIITAIQNEEEKFSRTLEKGLKEFEKVIRSSEAKLRDNAKLRFATPEIISGKDAFHLYDTYGFPIELTKELAKERGLKVDEEGFQEAFRKHQEISRAGLEKKFGGHGLGEAGVFSKEDEEKIKKLHTATHLLHQALQDVLGGQVKQMGSDINPERLRFDFTHPEKMTPEQIKQVEEIVNQKIKEDLPVRMEEMSPEQAIESGALAFFKEKYGEKVKVYSIGDYSKEICAGPHVSQTGQLGQLKIKKEQSSSAGVRRIKAVLPH